MLYKADRDFHFSLKFKVWPLPTEWAYCWVFVLHFCMYSVFFWICMCEFCISFVFTILNKFLYVFDLYVHLYHFRLDMTGFQYRGKYQFYGVTANLTLHMMSKIEFKPDNFNPQNLSCFFEKFKISKINGNTLLTLFRPFRAPEQKSWRKRTGIFWPNWFSI